METDELISLLAGPTARGYQLDAEQLRAVTHGGGPLWITAGPGSGKSEVLVTRTLKLLCVDRVKPASILLTTFTQKAAQSLEDRLSHYLSVLQEARPELSAIDLSELRLGTLHGLCSDLLRELRYPGYQNVRLLDEVERAMFMYTKSSLRTCDDRELWLEFVELFSDWPNKSYAPRTWERVKVGAQLFDRLVEERVQLRRLAEAGDHWERLVGLYEDYRDLLKRHHRCDYAHLQLLFLEMLDSPLGVALLQGEGATLPITHVLVDEYQDTNPIQERIYLSLARERPHNLTVVGDDDQSLYRFRGASVASMVNFDAACEAAFGVTPMSVQLTRNYRSHSGVVDFFNEYVTGSPVMQEPGARAPKKRPMLSCASHRDASYNPLCWIKGSRGKKSAEALACMVHTLLADGVISNLNQCVILLPSTKDTSRAAAPFLRALEGASIPYYNPRAQDYIHREEIQVALGGLLMILDPRGDYINMPTKGRSQADRARWMRACVQRCEDVINRDAGALDLREYITRSASALEAQIRRSPGEPLKRSVLDILYRLLACEPFTTWRRAPDREQRLAQLTRLIDGLQSIGKSELVSSADGQGLCAKKFWWSFNDVFLAYLFTAKINEDEDEEVIAPEGRLSIMTIHQSKGLEFPFVFVGKLGQAPRVGAAQLLEHMLSPFREAPYPRPLRAPEALAEEDSVRLHYVAYSRAERALCLVGDKLEPRALPAADLKAFKRRAVVIS